jgi:hypothetical protein
MRKGQMSTSIRGHLSFLFPFAKDLFREHPGFLCGFRRNNRDGFIFSKRAYPLGGTRDD